jgi:hypothetical protein
MTGPTTTPLSYGQIGPGDGPELTQAQLAQDMHERVELEGQLDQLIDVALEGRRPPE